MRKCMAKTSKSEMFAYGKFFTSFSYAFIKQVSNILEVYLITKFLMDSKYT